jgi:hypothetical protein
LAIDFTIPTIKKAYESLLQARIAKKSNAEIDYLLMIDGIVYPVEIKDGPSGKLRSLHIYRNTYQPSWSVVFHAGKASVLKGEKIVFLPLYFAGAFAQFGMDDKMELFDDLRL